MSVRSTYIIEDVQQCIYGLLSKLTSTTAPWTSWSVVLGWPETDVFKKLEKPFIYVLDPLKIDAAWQQGGLSLGSYQILLGLWDDRKTGGTEEINIMSSRLLDLFGNPSSAHTTKFDVITDATYTNTTLKAQGVCIDEIRGPRNIATEDLKEFRREFTLVLRA